MIRFWTVVGLAASMIFPSLALSSRIPADRADVARPGGVLPMPPDFALVKVAGGFRDPVNVTNAGDKTGRLFVVERAGRVWIVSADGAVGKEPFLDLTMLNPTVIDPQGNDVQSNFIEQGLYSIAFHPDFSNNGYFFVHYASLRYRGDGRIVRFQVDPATPDVVDAARARATEKEIMRIVQPSYNNNGGQIEFGPDGYLYIGIGDGGFSTPQGAGQDLSRWLGTILRIDVDVENDDVAYTIPKDNPFADGADGRQKEIWAYGLHNPYEFAFDPATGDLFVADVGDSHWEELNFQPASSKGGENYGWPRMEGSSCYPIFGETENTACSVTGILPAAQYPHPTVKAGATESSGELVCASVQGFGVARYAGMDGVYLVGDWCTGSIYGLGWDGARWQLQEVLRSNLHLTGGGYDEGGRVVVVSAKFYLEEDDADAPPRGALWRVVPTDEVPAGAEVAPADN